MTAFESTPLQQKVPVEQICYDDRGLVASNCTGLPGWHRADDGMDEPGFVAKNAGYGRNPVLEHEEVGWVESNETQRLHGLRYRFSSMQERLYPSYI